MQMLAAGFTNGVNSGKLLVTWRGGGGVVRAASWNLAEGQTRVGTA